MQINYAEWIDGLAILIGQYFMHQLTSELIEVLTDFDLDLALIGVEDCLSEIGKEGEILNVPQLPPPLYNNKLRMMMMMIVYFVV